MRQRLKIQPVRCVIIGRHGFGIAIDHNAFNARIFQRIGRVTAAIVKFNTLPDTVRPTAQNHRLFAVARFGLLLSTKGGRRIIAGIKIGRAGSELSRASVDLTEIGAHIQIVTLGAHAVFIAANQFGEPRIGKAHGFDGAHGFLIIGQAVLGNFPFHGDDVAQLFDKPRAEMRQTANIFLAHALAQRMCRHEQTRRGGGGQRGAHVGQAFFGAYIGRVFRCV